MAEYGLKDELQGFGRVKPDVVAYSDRVPVNAKPPTFAKLFPHLWEGAETCSTMSGTSIASPVVTAALAVAVSALTREARVVKANPAMLKQCLWRTAGRLPDLPIYSQGAGKLDVIGLAKCFGENSPSITSIPESVDLTDCYYFPFCTQPLYASAQPLVVNITLLNSLAVRSRIVTPPRLKQGRSLNVSFSWSPWISPWTGWLGLHITVYPHASIGNIRDAIVVVVNCSGGVKHLEIPIHAEIIPKPPRNVRLLWDQHHQLYFPFVYAPNDILTGKGRRRVESFGHTQITSLMDWPADHLYTTYLDMFNLLRSSGYFIEVLAKDATTFDAMNFGALLLFDPEANFTDVEVSKITNDVSHMGLGLFVAAGWHSENIQRKLSFFDEAEGERKLPVTGGSNVPRYVCCRVYIFQLNSKERRFKA